jgi:hypothetical protein
MIKQSITRRKWEKWKWVGECGNFNLTRRKLEEVGGNAEDVV